MLTVKIERKEHTFIEECTAGIAAVTPKHKDFDVFVKSFELEERKPLAFVCYKSPNCMDRYRKMYGGEKVYIMNDIGKTIDTLYFNNPSDSEDKLNS
jgi:hypothetical protein